MRYHIVVCDDSKAIRDKIVKALRSLEQELNENFEIEQFASAEELLSPCRLCRSGSTSCHERLRPVTAQL